MNTKTSSRSSPRLALTHAMRTGDYDDSSHDWKDHYTPHTIYFYYRTLSELRVYRRITPDPISRAALDGHIIELTKNARAGGSNPLPIGWAFKDVPWQKRSYLVVAVDIPNVVFDPGNAVTITRDDGSPHGHPNHSFFDGWDGAIEIPTKPPEPSQEPIQVMWTVNYMKSKSGKDIPAGRTHKFDLDFHSKGGKNIKDGRRRRSDDGDSGTNMGPPVPPP
jgi:hypothetical protein